MSDVERMYRHLVRTIRAGFPQYLTQPFEVGELYQTILPYRLHRRELGLETNSDFEHTLLEMLTGAEGYVVLDDRMRDVLAADRTAGNPDPARIREFSAAHVRLAPEALARIDSSSVRQSSAGATISRAAVVPPVAEKPVAERPAATSRRITKPVVIPEEGGSCQYCKGGLPGGREISYCPHCGQNLTVDHCPACGSELEKGWKFCVACGRGTA